MLMKLFLETMQTSQNSLLEGTATNDDDGFVQYAVKNATSTLY